jgi:hypothetical protein
MAVGKMTNWDDCRQGRQDGFRKNLCGQNDKTKWPLELYEHSSLLFWCSNDKAIYYIVLNGPKW